MFLCRLSDAVPPGKDGSDECCSPGESTAHSRDILTFAVLCGYLKSLFEKPLLR